MIQNFSYFELNEKLTEYDLSVDDVNLIIDENYISDIKRKAFRAALKNKHTRKLIYNYKVMRDKMTKNRIGKLKLKDDDKKNINNQLDNKIRASERQIAKKDDKKNTNTQLDSKNQSSERQIAN